MTSPFSDEDLYRGILDEIRMRHQVYPNLVKIGRMKPDEAQHKIALMEAVRERFTELVKFWKSGEGKAPGTTAPAPEKDQSDHKAEVQGALDAIEAAATAGTLKLRDLDTSFIDTLTQRVSKYRTVYLSPKEAKWLHGLVAQSKGVKR